MATKNDLKNFGTTPLDEPEIYELFKSDMDMFTTLEKFAEIVEERVGHPVDPDFLGQVRSRIFDVRDDKGNFKKTPKTENIEPLKFRDLVKFSKWMEDNKDGDLDKAIEELRNYTDIPDDLDTWEKKLVVEQMLTYAMDAMKTALGVELGN